MKLVEELGLPELTNEEIEQLCTIAENAAKKYILSKINAKGIEKLDIFVEAEGTKPLDLNIEIDLVLSPQLKDLDPKEIVAGAIDKAFEAGEKFLRKLK